MTENLFDILRNGQRQVTPELMDVVLRALDTVNSQFEEISNRQEPTNASPDLIKELTHLVEGNDSQTKSDPSDNHVNPVSQDSSSSNKASEKIDIKDDEFEEFLDAINQEEARVAASDSSAAVSTSSSDDITDEEFEN